MNCSTGQFLDSSGLFNGCLQLTSGLSRAHRRQEAVPISARSLLVVQPQLTYLSCDRKGRPVAEALPEATLNCTGGGIQAELAKGRRDHLVPSPRCIRCRGDLAPRGRRRRRAVAVPLRTLDFLYSARQLVCGLRRSMGPSSGGDVDFFFLAAPEDHDPAALERIREIGPLRLVPDLRYPNQLVGRWERNWIKIRAWELE